jgi:glycosyl transferase family 25
MKVFVIHYRKLTERKEFILEQFERYGITDYEFVEIDRNELAGHNIEMFRKGYNPVHIAICLSHFYVYKQIADSYTHALILEDDAILSDGFLQILEQYMKELPGKYDMLFIGDGCNFHIHKSQIQPEKHVYRKEFEATSVNVFGGTRCTDSYIVSQSCATELCKYISSLKGTIGIPIDNWLNIPILQCKFHIFWAEPTIVTQGTQNGMFSTSY